METRLDRLFLLLDTGSSAVTRKAAAQQLGQVQHLHPHELPLLLRKVCTFLKSPSWDTRIAASQAVHAILSQVPQWQPPLRNNSNDNGEKEGPEEQPAADEPPDRLSFATFDVAVVLARRHYLTASEGREFDADDERHGGVDPKERLKAQRTALNQRLGLDLAAKLGIDTGDLVQAEDLEVHRQQQQQQRPNDGTGEPTVQEEMSRLSSREANRAKRKARQGAKIKARDLSRETSPSAPSSSTSSSSMAAGGGDASSAGADDGSGAKRRKKDRPLEPDAPLLVDAVPDPAGGWPDSAHHWPFDGFCDLLVSEMFSASWEARHGAGTTLRELVQLHGRGAGRTTRQTADQRQRAHADWLEDTALRLLCVLALDRFGDFISDQVVAPVRETAAQALGCLATLMAQPHLVRSSIAVLLQLLQQPEWEARHGGLLGLKYLMAARQDLSNELLPVVYPALFTGLQDGIDDVSAVAAAALMPLADPLVKLLTADELRLLLDTLWDALLELDELTASTSSILTLLSSLVAHPQALPCLQLLPLERLVPRLWPFLSHSSSQVRRATLRTLETLLLMRGPPAGVAGWIESMATDMLRHVFQRALLEHGTDILNLVETVWSTLCRRLPLQVLLPAACPYVAGWICLVMQPSRVPFDPASLIFAAAERKDELRRRAGHADAPAAAAATAAATATATPTPQCPPPPEGRTQEEVTKHLIGGTDHAYENAAARERGVVRARCLATKLLGVLSRYIVRPMPGLTYTDDMETPVECYAKLLAVHLASRSSVQRTVVANVLAEWALAAKSQPPQLVKQEPKEEMPESKAEVAVVKQEVQEAKQELAEVKKEPDQLQEPLEAPAKMLQETDEARPPAWLLERIHQSLTECVYYDEIGVAFTRVLHEAKDFMATLKHYKLDVESAFPAASSTFLTMEQIHQLSGPVAVQLLASGKLKSKILEMLDDRRKTLLNSCQQVAGDQLSLSNSTQSALARAVVAIGALTEKLNPVIKPLMDSIRTEENSQVQMASARTLAGLLELTRHRTPCPNAKILKNVCGFLCADPEFTPRATATGTPSDADRDGILTLEQQQRAAERASGSSSSSAGANGRGTDASAADAAALELQRRGATMVLEAAAQLFDADFPAKASLVWDLMMAVNVDGQDADQLIQSLQIIQVVGPATCPALHDRLLELMTTLARLLSHEYRAVRHMAARCLAALGGVDAQRVLVCLVDAVLPLLDVSEAVHKRQGAMEALICIVERLGLRIVPYIVLLVIPVLGRMSDRDAAVRLAATQSFAGLIRLMPLQCDDKADEHLPPRLLERHRQQRAFLDQLLDPKKVADFVVPVPVQAQLRSYQQDGVNWLAFLKRYNLHGILCDDMGLGKTLQTICILAADHEERQRRADEPLPSLVVCPPTLTGHWVYEVEKFVGPQHLNPLHYTGPPAERQRLRQRLALHNLVVASYDIVRNDVDFFADQRWNYCVLDEGHVIKNGKTKSSRAIKRLVANHRLILSGTPIQNNVLELWSLFDFLIPGFLGSEKQFQARYSKPILASRDAKASSKEQEAGALAMEALHRQTLPFLLRRMKEDVLKDLPPKITQDYYCEMSPLQVQLYEDFAKQHATLRQVTSTSVGGAATPAVPIHSHIFQALQYLRKVCNHPKLVLTALHPQQEAIQQQLRAQKSNLSELQHSAKLLALRQLLLDCGIGVAAGAGADTGAVSIHRALVFCQLRSMIDIIEKDLLRAHMPTVSFLRLDGGVTAGARHSVVKRFNEDPSIDVLLLTTQVGGLGLNLTGADTVIFVEHDWNPMKDLQAMDRAHRIGQKKVVTVYRLITRGTLEEKIMGLQKFKLDTANTIISAENASLQSMATDQLLDLFALDDVKGGQKKSAGRSSVADSANGGGGGGGLPSGFRTALEALPELWSQEQYDTEYDLDTFIANLNSQPR